MQRIDLFFYLGTGILNQPTTCIKQYIGDPRTYARDAEEPFQIPCSLSLTASEIWTRDAPIDGPNAKCKHKHNITLTLHMIC